MKVAAAAAELARAEALTGGGRVEARITLAVAAPAALVAVGALLLVYAHAGAPSTDARVNAALAFTRATLEPVEGEPRAYEEIATAAGRHGYSMTVSDEPAHEVRSQVDPHGEVTVHAPYGTRSVVVRFDAGAPGDNLSLVVAVAGLGIAFAALLGGRLGSALSHDVEVARLQVDAMGARDVRRGIRLRKQAAFRPVHASPTSPSSPRPAASATAATPRSPAAPCRPRSPPASSRPSAPPASSSCSASRPTSTRSAACSMRAGAACRPKCTRIVSRPRELPPSGWRCSGRCASTRPNSA